MNSIINDIGQIDYNSLFTFMGVILTFAITVVMVAV